MYLLDTNICIYAMKGQFPCLNDHLFSLDPADVAISSITVFELEYGAFKSNWGEKTRTNLKLFLAPFVILPFDGNDAVTAGYIRSFLVKQGLTIGPYDVQLAGQALARKLTLVTHNTGEFRRVPQLKTEDWVLQ